MRQFCIILILAWMTVVAAPFLGAASGMAHAADTAHAQGCPDRADAAGHCLDHSEIGCANGGACCAALLLALPDTCSDLIAGAPRYAIHHARLMRPDGMGLEPPPPRG